MDKQEATREILLNYAETIDDGLSDGCGCEWVGGGERSIGDTTQNDSI